MLNVVSGILEATLGRTGKLLLKMSLLRFCKMNLVCTSQWTSWAASRKYSACDWRVDDNEPSSVGRGDWPGLAAVRMQTRCSVLGLRNESEDRTAE